MGDLRVEEIATPGAPAPGEIIVSVEAAGICGSDIHNFKTGMWISRVPSTPGHEFCGVVSAVGAGVSRLRAGDRVVADSRVYCGSCDMCRAGNRNLCRSIGYVGEVIDGGFAPWAKIGDELVYLLPDQATDPAVAAMTEPLSVALHARHRLAPLLHEPVLVTGAGPIGAMVAIVLAHYGFGPLLILDRNIARADLVARLTGATVIGLDRVTDFACGQAVETTGSAKVLDGIAAAMTPGGRIASVGIFHGSDGFDLNRIVEREIELVGCAAFRDEMPEALGLLAPLSPALKALASTPIPLAGVPAAYASHCAGNAASIKTIILPGLAGCRTIAQH
ncbi:zinc-binding dehydrogenase [soil metagenome]